MEGTLDVLKNLPSPVIEKFLNVLKDDSIRKVQSTNPLRLGCGKYRISPRPHSIGQPGGRIMLKSDVASSFSAMLGSWVPILTWVAYDSFEIQRYRGVATHSASRLALHVVAGP